MLEKMTANAKWR